MSTTENDLLRAGEQIASLENHLADAKAAVTSAEAARNEVSSLIRDLDAVRGDIIARRQRGEKRDDDGAVLELAAADREGLVSILAEREAALVAVRNPVATISRELEMARIVFARMEGKRIEDALRERLENLSELMVKAIDQMRENRTSLGQHGQLPWVPSRGLMDRLTPLDLGRSW